MNVGSQWTVYRTRFLVHARQLTQPLVFTDALGREQSGQPGDYLVESCDGLRHITRRAIFEDVYVPLGPSQRYSTAVAQAAVAGSQRTSDGVPNALPRHSSPDRLPTAALGSSA